MSKFSVDGSAYSAVAVTPSDSKNIGLTRGLYVGVAGDINIIPADGDGTTAVLIKAALAGVVYPFGVQKVLATNTTATNIVALY